MHRIERLHQEREAKPKLATWAEKQGFLLVIPENVMAPVGILAALMWERIERKLFWHGDEDLVSALSRGREIAEEEYARVGKIYRQSGDETMTHPLWMVDLLWEVGMRDRDILVAAMVHDLPEDTGFGLDRVEDEFGEHVAGIVGCLTKIQTKKLSMSKAAADQLKTLEKIYSLLDYDPRGVLIKLADSSHNMLTLFGITDVAKRERKAGVAMRYFVPLARLFGLPSVAEKIEMGIMRGLNPEEAETESERLWESMENWRGWVEERASEWMANAGVLGLLPNEVRVELPSVYQANRRQMEGEASRMLPRVKIVARSGEQRRWWEYLLHEGMVNGVARESFEGDVIEEEPDYPVMRGRVVEWRLGEEVEVEVVVASAEAEVRVVDLWIGGKLTQEKKELAEKKLALVRRLYEQELGRGWGAASRFVETLIGKRKVVLDRSGRPWILPREATGGDFAFKIHSEIGVRAVGLMVKRDGGEWRKVGLSYVPESGDQVVVETGSSLVSPNYYDQVRLLKSLDEIRRALNLQMEIMDDLGDVRAVNELRSGARERGEAIIGWLYYLQTKKRLGRLMDGRQKPVQRALEQLLVEVGLIPRPALARDVEDEWLSVEARKSSVRRKVLRIVENLRRD